eukprot:362110-Chlamydomonas_euryale.AAC.4
MMRARGSARAEDRTAWGGAASCFDTTQKGRALVRLDGLAAKPHTRARAPRNRSVASSRHNEVSVWATQAVQSALPSGRAGRLARGRSCCVLCAAGCGAVRQRGLECGGEPTVWCFPAPRIEFAPGRAFSIGKQTG